VLGLGLDATPEQIEEARRQQDGEEQDWREFADDVQLASVISTLRLKRREAHRVLTDPPNRARYDRRLGELKPATGPEAAGPASGVPEPPAPAAPEPPADPDRTRRLRREAIGLLDRGQVDDAVARLLEVVERTPGDKDAHRLLALALTEHPTLFRTAERHFVAALEAEPRDFELRWRLALFYKRASLPARALVQLHALLAMAPDHAEARRELEAFGKD
jgi:thioredoxin-like negative regulator of GroEL